MAAKIKRLTEEERQAELKAYAFEEGLKGFFDNNVNSRTVSNPIGSISLDAVSNSIPVSDSVPVLNTIPVPNSEPVLKTVPVMDSIPDSILEPVFNSIDISNSVPVLNSIPDSNPEPILDSSGISNSVPVSNLVPVLDSIPDLNSVPILNSENISNSRPVSKTRHIENDTRTESDIYRNNYCVKALRTLKIQNKSLAALGMLFLLRSLLPSSGGRIKIDRIVSATGMSKSNILAQLEALENARLITTLVRDVSGRLISFPKGIENDTGTKFEMGLEFETENRSSCINNLKTTTTTTEVCKSTEIRTGIGNETGTEFGMGPEFDTDLEFNMENSSCINNLITTITTGKDKSAETSTGIEFDTGFEFNTGIEFKNETEVTSNINAQSNAQSIDTVFKNKLHNNIVSLKFSAQELFFIVKASKVGVDKLTEQCFKHYHHIKGNMGGKYANGLFLSLLSKAKDSPTAYVIKAIQQGATASPDDEIRAEKVIKAGEAIFKEIGTDILRKDLENALLLLSLNGQPQEMIQQECKIFVERMMSQFK